MANVFQRVFNPTQTGTVASNMLGLAGRIFGVDSPLDQASDKREAALLKFQELVGGDPTGGATPDFGAAVQQFMQTPEFNAVVADQGSDFLGLLEDMKKLAAPAARDIKTLPQGSTAAEFDPTAAPGTPGTVVGAGFPPKAGPPADVLDILRARAAGVLTGTVFDNVEPNAAMNVLRNPNQDQNLTAARMAGIASGLIPSNPEQQAQAAEGLKLLAPTNFLSQLFGGTAAPAGGSPAPQGTAAPAAPISGQPAPAASGPTGPTVQVPGAAAPGSAADPDLVRVQGLDEKGLRALVDSGEIDDMSPAAQDLALERLQRGTLGAPTTP